MKMRFSVAALVAAFVTHAAFAADLLVPQQYPTIQAAVNAAVTGDTVVVAPGTWSGFDCSGKALNVRSSSGFATTRINSQFTASVAADSSNPNMLSLRLEGFTLLSANGISRCSRNRDSLEFYDSV